MIELELSKELPFEICRRFLLTNEPWITLGYTEEEMRAVTVSARDGEVIYAKRDGEVAGFALWQPRFLHGGYLRVLVVDQDLRGQGIGRKLMAEFERRAFSFAPNTYLCVSDFNTGARRFYEGQGYGVVGELKDLQIEGKSEILMRKTIGPKRGRSG